MGVRFAKVSRGMSEHAERCLQSEEGTPSAEGGRKLEVAGWCLGVAGLALGHTVVAQLVLLCCAVYRFFRDRRAHTARSWPRPNSSSAALLALAAWMLITAPFALKPANAFGSTLGAMLTGWLVLDATRKAAADGAGPRLVPVFLGAASAGALYALAGFGMFAARRGGFPRAQLPFVGCNAAGTIMAVAAIIAFGLVVTARRSSQRLGLAACFALVFAALLATQSRGALVGFAAGLAALVAALLCQPSSQGIRCKRAVGPTIAMAAMAALLLLLVALGLRHPTIAARYSTILDLGANRDRLEIWRAAFAIIRDHPIVGVGVNNFGHAYQVYSQASSPLNQPFAHNVFLEFGAATGVPGLVLTGAVMAVGAWNGLRAVKTGGRECSLGAASIALAVFVAILVHLQFDLTIYSIDMLPLFFVPYGVLAWLRELAIRTGPAG